MRRPNPIDVAEDKAIAIRQQDNRDSKLLKGSIKVLSDYAYNVKTSRKVFKRQQHNTHHTQATATLEMLKDLQAVITELDNAERQKPNPFQPIKKGVEQEKERLIRALKDDAYLHVRSIVVALNTYLKEEKSKTLSPNLDTVFNDAGFNSVRQNNPTQTSRETIRQVTSQLKPTSSAAKEISTTTLSDFYNKVKEFQNPENESSKRYK